MHLSGVVHDDDTRENDAWVDGLDLSSARRYRQSQFRRCIHVHHGNCVINEWLFHWFNKDRNYNRSQLISTRSFNSSTLLGSELRAKVQSKMKHATKNIHMQFLAVLMSYTFILHSWGFRHASLRKQLNVILINSTLFSKSNHHRLRQSKQH